MNCQNLLENIFPFLYYMTLKVKALLSFKTSGTAELLANDILEDLSLKTKGL
jgi:hypothetical protein